MKKSLVVCSALVAVVAATGLGFLTRADLAAAPSKDPSPPNPAASKGEAPDPNRIREAVDRGLAYLASHQDKESGGWKQDIGFKFNDRYEVTLENKPHVGVTSLALMAFISGGHIPGRGRYGEVVQKGLDYVLACVDADTGSISANETRMYSHAFATLFLAEVYGMVERADVKRVLQRSVDLIVDSQNSEGGWRYRPFARESDMSITVCQVLALRSARNVGIHVPISTIRNAQNYVYRSAVRSNDRTFRGGFRGHGDDGGSFRYQNRDHTRATFPLTAAGVTTLYAAGEYDSPIIRDALDYMDRQVDSFSSDWQNHYFFFYGHYYAVQAYYITGDPKWTRYFRLVKSQLFKMQQRDGSWPCTAGPGEAFATAVATLVLQIPLQYLPIFQR